VVTSRPRGFVPGIELKYQLVESQNDPRERGKFFPLPDLNLGSPSPSPSQYTDYIKMQKEELSTISVLQSSLLACLMMTMMMIKQRKKEKDLQPESEREVW